VPFVYILQEGTSNYFKGLMLILCYLIVAASFFVHVDPTASNYLFSLLSLDARALFIGSKSQGMLRLHEFSQWDDVFVYTITSFPCQEKWLPVTSNVIYICSYKMILWFQSFMHLCKFCNP
jgi:Ca2+/H+ antiporter